jgi:O-antigen/teichoic acid export membrane protein
LLLVWMGGSDARYILLGYILASLIANEVGAILRRRSGAEEPVRSGLEGRNLGREVWGYALPLIPVELLSWFNGLGDRYVIGYLMSATDVGLYAAAYTLTNEAFSRSAVIVYRTFQPAYFQHCSSNRWKQARRIFLTWLACVGLLGGIGVVALAFLKDWVAKLLLAEAYYPAAQLMPLIGVGCALQALGTVAAQPLLAAKRTRSVLLGRVVGAATAAVSIPLMVSSHGLTGAALAAPIYFGVEALVLAMLAGLGRRRETPSLQSFSLLTEEPVQETSR